MATQTFWGLLSESIMTASVLEQGVLLFLVVLSSQIFFQLQGYPGFGWGAVAAHALAAVIAVLLQVVADRRRGGVSALASLAVVLDAAVTLWLFWWS